LRHQFHNEWFVTYDKIALGRQIADALCIDLWGFLYLVPDDIVMRVKLSSYDGGWLQKFRIEKTETQATVNGGTAVRENAYINMINADILRPVERSHDRKAG
jgi:hypothetical protein